MLIVDHCSGGGKTCKASLPGVRLAFALYWLALARPVVADDLELHWNITNLGEQTHDPLSGLKPGWSQFVVLLANHTADLKECGSLCAEYTHTAGPRAECRSFSRYATAVGAMTGVGYCFGHLDPIWLPLSGKCLVIVQQQQPY